MYSASFDAEILTKLEKNLQQLRNASSDQPLTGMQLEAEFIKWRSTTEVCIDELGCIEFMYKRLSPRDKMIFDMKTGGHGKVPLPHQEIARRLGVTPALISQRSRQIASLVDLACSLAKQ